MILPLKFFHIYDARVTMMTRGRYGIDLDVFFHIYGARVTMTRRGNYFFTYAMQELE